MGLASLTRCDSHVESERSGGPAETTQLGVGAGKRKPRDSAPRLLPQQRNRRPYPCQGLGSKARSTPPASPALGVGGASVRASPPRCPTAPCANPLWTPADVRGAGWDPTGSPAGRGGGPGARTVAGRPPCAAESSETCWLWPGGLGTAGTAPKRARGDSRTFSLGSSVVSRAGVEG